MNESEAITLEQLAQRLERKRAAIVSTRPSGLGELAENLEARMVAKMNALAFAYCPDCRQVVSTKRPGAGPNVVEGSEVCPACLEERTREAERVARVPAIANIIPLPSLGRYIPRQLGEDLQAMAWARDYARRPAIVVQGSVKAGKSTLCRELAVRIGLAGEWIRAALAANERADQVRLFAAPVLVLDDLGMAHGHESQWENLSAIISERWDRRRPTIISTTLRPSDLAAKNVATGDRLASALWVPLTQAGVPAAVREGGYR